MSQSAEKESNQQSDSQDAGNLEQETKVVDAWAKSSKDLVDQYKNKFDAFKAMTDQAGYIEESSFKIGGEQKSEIFKRMDADGDGKITQQEWTQGWNNLDTQVQETHHKVQIAQQKMQILDALESKAEPGMSLNQPINSHYSSMVDKFKNSSTLGDLTDFLNKKSPFRDEDHSNQSSLNYDFKKQSGTRPLDSLLQQFTTPGKQEIFVDTGSGQGSGQYYQKPQQQQVQKFGFVQSSASPGFIPQQQFQYKSDSSINSKVFQQMNLNLDVKDHNKTNKRKEELSNFMGKLGLGKQEVAQRPTISAEQPNLNVFERMKYFVNNIGSSNVAQKKQSSGLNGLVNDTQFNTTTFKQQVKLYRKDKGDPVEQQPSRLLKGPTLENPLLQDQSLKSFHLKLMHQQTAGSSNKFTRI